jgi:hypothetical protein
MAKRPHLGCLLSLRAEEIESADNFCAQAAGSANIMNRLMPTEDVAAAR